MSSTNVRSFLFFPVVILVAGGLAAQQPSTAVERQLAELPQSHYFLIPAKNAAAPANGSGLLVVVPGGDGSREFLPWVESAVHAQLPPDFATALVVAPKWRDDQKIVWPTTRSPEAGMQYPTERYLRAVVADVRKHTAIDGKRVLLLAWSSGGPAAWATLLADESPFTGAYVAMSIWPPADAAALAHAKGLRVQLDQSPQDQVTRFFHARKAHEVLSAAGAQVRVTSYHGGHGWQDLPLPRLKAGFRWLLGKDPAGKPKWPEAAAGPAGDNLLANGSFEDGDQGWQTVANSSRLQREVVADGAKDGKRALRLQKTGGMPLDLVLQEVAELPAAGTLTARAWVKPKGCKNAWIKCFLYRGDEVVHEDVDLARLTGDGDWRQVEKSWELGGATRAVFQIVMVMGGELLVDGCEVSVQAAAKGK